MASAVRGRRQDMTEPRALDLFCGAGGATKGLQRAGFHVTGIDIKRQPRYCGDLFIQADALRPPVRLEDFDLIWASPPCQAYSVLRFCHGPIEYPDLVEQTRNLLLSTGKPYVIENVPGSPLRGELMLCGTMFDAVCEDGELWRHRIFEMSWRLPLLLDLNCRHRRLKKTVVNVGGGGKHGQVRDMQSRRRVMGIDWMDRKTLSEAIPPAYAEYIGRAALAQCAGEGRR
jgi:DNA (cytosine-5)-methyltransferase 1